MNLHQLVSVEAQHRVARVLTARGTFTPSLTLEDARARDTANLCDLTDDQRSHYLRLRCAELMFEFGKATLLATEYGRPELVDGYETLATLIGSPERAVTDYIEASRKSPDDAHARAYEREFLDTA